MLNFLKLTINGKKLKLLLSLEVFKQNNPKNGSFDFYSDEKTFFYFDIISVRFYHRDKVSFIWTQCIKLQGESWSGSIQWSQGAALG